MCRIVTSSKRTQTDTYSILKPFPASSRLLEQNPSNSTRFFELFLSPNQPTCLLPANEVELLEGHILKC